ncbi:Glycogen synthase [compost metagenome]
MLAGEDVQFVVLGAGEGRYEQFLQAAEHRHPDKVAVRLGYDDRLARRIYGGSDMFAMPSQFEPCGLSQLLALRYRSVPIVRETGGLKDTVAAYNEYTGEGNGFSFLNYNAHDYMYTLRRALHLYRCEETWKHIVDNGSKEDLSWKRSAKDYVTVYSQLAANRKERDLWLGIS